LPVRIHLAEPGVVGLSHDEIQHFLANGKIPMRLATVGGDGSPVIYPVWYHYANDRFYVFSRKKARKMEDMERNTTVYFSIDTETFPNKGVKGRATARMIADPNEGVPIVEEMLEKYLGDTKSSYPKAMIESVRKGSAVVVEIRPHYYTVWDYTKGL
jgi:nitroimidazol reductase NimA-like FMN-containing flavoprotein (pyridoxamine 5'-phosphate oxidase superfamily)